MKTVSAFFISCCMSVGLIIQTAYTFVLQININNNNGMNNSFLSFLTPKEPKFFPLLRGLSDIIYNASVLLEEGIRNYGTSDTEEFAKKIKEQEKAGDLLSNKIFDELNSTFITPFDREDIHSLADTMDDVIDRINSTVKKIALYQPKVMPALAVDLAHQMVVADTILQQATDDISHIRKNSNNIKKTLVDLDAMEHKADDIFNHFLIELFNTEKDAIEFIKLKEIMAEMERATDIAESVGKIIQTIIVKYA